MNALLLVPLPLLVTGILLVAAVLPWGGPDWTEMALALLPVGAIYFWSFRRPHLMPAVLVFLAGLLLDVMTHGPLGIWSCAALMAALAGRTARRARPDSGWLHSTFHMIMTLSISAAVVAALMSLYAWRLVPGLPLVHALAAACLGYPVLAGLLSLLDGAWPAADDRPLFLRGD